MNTHSPKVVAEIVEIAPELIDPDHAGRIGQYFPLKAEVLAARIAEDGQNEPIAVVKAGPRAKLPWRLVFGLHRLEACHMLGRPVLARIVSGDADALRRMQASENLDRRRMTPLEQAMFVAAVSEAAMARLRAVHGDVSDQALGGLARSARGNLPRADDPALPERPQDRADAADREAEEAAGALAEVYSWRAEAADACGLNIDALKRSLRIYRHLIEPHRPLIDAIKDHAIADNTSALLTLARKAPATRIAALEWLANNPKARTIDEALAAVGPPKSASNSADADNEKITSAISGSWGRLSLQAQNNYLPRFVKMLTPGQKVGLRDQLNRELGDGGA